MAYIGNTNQTQAFTPAIDYFNGTGSTTAFTLSRPVASVAQVQAVIENVPQNPGSAYTVSGNTITFTSAPPSGTNNIYVYYTSPITQVIAPGQGTVYPSSLSTGGMYWDTNSNVGIGTTSPPSYGSGGKTLLISGSQFPNVGLSATASSTGNKNYRWIARDDASGGPIMQFQTLDDSWASEQNIWYVSRSTTGISYQSWYTGAAGSNAERMRIDSSGTVFMGQTTNPATGTLVLKVPTGTGNGCNAQITSNTGTSYPWSNYNASGTYIGGMTATSSATGFPTSSDVRLKKNIEDAPSAIDKVLTAQVVSHDWINDDAHVEYGFIAQDLQKVIPQAVVEGTDKEDGTIDMPWGVDYSKIVPLLTKAIQELKAEVDELKAKLEAK